MAHKEEVVYCKRELLVTQGALGKEQVGEKLGGVSKERAVLIVEGRVGRRVVEFVQRATVLGGGCAP